jgi:sugar phosphate permease
MQASTRQAIADSEALSSVTLHKVTRRLIPFLFPHYIIAWLDRVNVGFAALHMNSDLGFSSAAFGFGSGIFFLGYCLFTADLFRLTGLLTLAALSAPLLKFVKQRR